MSVADLYGDALLEIGDCSGSMSDGRTLSPSPTDSANSRSLQAYVSTHSHTFTLLYV